ncbi:MAG TPA: Lrp/AsnC family transcriptional regulator [Thermoanaerobaculia bacterium]|nr:Lrp/AsnC family transcriptional regulator [Thermoanaerobaculia bacterium]HUM30141.1 Lrp/AsnC family transcriptional regulator [Thermoanaerobaculia bacterium]HXK68409.1 Lrp/AsnC family transcriptional regulator [Thermoanaerobaculia bacterium]
MKSKEKLILSYLRRNARETLTSLSKLTGFPVSTLHDKVKKYKSNTICRYTVLFNEKILGYEIKVHVLIKSLSPRREELIDYLKCHPNVNRLARINNGFNLFMELIFASIQEVEDFLEEMSGRFHISEKKVYWLVDEILRENFFSDPEIAKACILQQEMREAM